MMIHQNIKKFIQLCFIISCVYTVLFMDSMTTQKNVTSNVQFEITTDNHTLPKPPTKYSDFKEELKIRRALIQNVCARKPLNTPKYVQHSEYKKVLLRLYIDRRHKLAWCPTFKAASSTIMRLFASLGGLLTKEVELQLQNQQTQIDKITRREFTQLKRKNASKIVQNSNRLLVVRHPFARLLSAYRDKLEHREKREYYYQKFGKHIVQSFGYPEKQVEPTFVDFLKAIVKRYPSDEHWRPYFIQCAPCLLKYNFILKTEFLDEELEQVLTSLHLADHYPKAENMNTNGTTDYQIIEKYFSSVPLELLREVYKVYELDFELFKYSPHQYFNMTRS